MNTDSLLLWFLPDAWFQVDLLAPDARERVEGRLRERIGGELGEDVFSQLVAAEVQMLEEAVAQGVILLATYDEGELGEGDLPAGLSLTLAVAELPASTDEGGERAGGERGGGESGSGEERASGFAASVTPLGLGDPDVTGFVRELRSPVQLPGREASVNRFQVQAFVTPANRAATAVATVTTFDGGWEDRARTVARTFADTLIFLDAGDDSGDEPDPTDPDSDEGEDRSAGAGKGAGVEQDR